MRKIKKKLSNLKSKRLKLKLNPYNWSTKGRISDRKLGKFRQEIFDNIIFKQLINVHNFKIIQNSSNGVLCYFELNENENIFNKFFNKGIYILKLESITNQKIIFLQKLSDLNLIPEIFLIENIKQFDHLASTYLDDNIINIPTIIIMEFIDGIDLDKLESINHWEINKKDLTLRNYIWKNIEKENLRWQHYNIKHNDLAPKNIILTKNGKIIFIDPLIKEHLNDDDALQTIKYVLLG